MKPCILFAATLLAAAGLAAQAMPATQPAPRLQGEVLEVLTVPSYTYLRLKTKEGEVWAAVSSTPVAKGAQVTLEDTMVMENFESKALKRKFSKIVFGSLAGGKAASPHGGATPKASAPVGKIAKAAAADGKTVAEVVAGKAALKDKSVTIHAQVVKVTAGVLGKNWLHLQDGSGSPANGSHDIVVTTKENAAVGDVVNASGTVRTDVNLGSGYAYAVMVEDAKIRR